MEPICECKSISLLIDGKEVKLEDVSFFMEGDKMVIKTDLIPALLVMMESEGLI